MSTPDGRTLPAGSLPDDVPLPLDPPPALVAADAPPGETYGREQAARVLGVSPRRVSQLAADGRLEVVQDRPLRLAAESVHSLRAERRGPHADQRATTPPPDAADVAAQVERVAGLLAAANLRALTASESVLAEVQGERDRLLVRVENLQAETVALRAELDRVREQLAAQPRRRWWR